MDNNRKYINSTQVWKGHSCKILEAGQINDGKKILSTYDFSDSKIIYIHLGINDIKKLENIDDTAKEIINLGMLAKKENPHAEIIISEILVRGDFLNEKIIELNNLLEKSLPESLNIIKHRNITRDILFDKIHVKENFIQHIIRNMKDKLRELITYNKINWQNEKKDQLVRTRNEEIIQNIRNTGNVEKEMKPVLKLLVVGSSIVRDIVSKKIEKCNPDLAHTECIPGGKTQDVIDRVKQLAKIYSIKNIIVHIGGNHISYDRPEVIIDKLINMYKNLHEITPLSKVYHSNILPRFHNYISGIRFINTEMEKFCSKYKITVINHPQFYDNERTNYKLLKNDYVHPTPFGTLIIAKNIIAAYRKYDML